MCDVQGKGSLAYAALSSDCDNRYRTAKSTGRKGEHFANGRDLFTPTGEVRYFRWKV